MADKPKKYKARITFLEMTARKHVAVPMPMKPPLALMRAENIPVGFYRYLYEQVGRKHHWYERRKLDDAALDSIINADSTQIDILYADGCPAGFFELDLSTCPDKVEIAYFGLCENYVGRGLAKWFLWNAIETAWDNDPGKVTVHTNTLDHPRALPLYQKMGFEPVGISEETVEAWD